MPEFMVKGIDDNTGKARCAVVDAPSKDAAINMAGFVVESVQLLSEERPKPDSETRPDSFTKTHPVITALLCGIAVYFVLFLVVVLVISYPSTAPANDQKHNPVPKRTRWIYKDNSLTALFMMKEFVKDRLRSPSTASFPANERNHMKTKRLENHMYYVTGSVDAQNAFGATIRSDFKGVVQQTWVDEWQLVDFEMTGR